MENMVNFVKDVVNVFRAQPWYAKVQLILGAVVVLVVLFFVLALCAEITKTLFTIDFASICYFIYERFQEGLPDMDKIVLGIALCVILAVLFFFLTVSDEEGMGVIELFFNSLLGGIINVGIIMAMGSVVLIPLIVSCWERDSRY